MSGTLYTSPSDIRIPTSAELKLQMQREAIAEFVADPNHIPPEGSLFCRPRILVDPNQKIEVCILDNNMPKGKIFSPDKRKAVEHSLFEMMYHDLMSEADISPKFQWSKWRDGMFHLNAVGESSAEYLKDMVDRMPPPYPRAQLYVDYRSRKRVMVEAYVPGEMVYFRNTLKHIMAFDSKIRADQWHAIAGRPHADGYVYTFTILETDFKQLDQYNGFIPYNGTQIEFRVINNDNFMQNAM